MCAQRAESADHPASVVGIFALLFSLLYALGGGAAALHTRAALASAGPVVHAELGYVFAAALATVATIGGTFALIGFTFRKRQPAYSLALAIASLVVSVVPAVLWLSAVLALR